ncbi:MAG: hypothetical protein WD740_06925 [Anaerolineales bacterium]
MPPQLVTFNTLKLIVGLLATILLGACSKEPVNSRIVIERATQSSEPTASPSPTTPIAYFNNNATFDADLRLVYPGTGSRLASPILLIATVPAGTSALRVELFGEDGRLLLRKLLLNDGSGQLELELVFEVPALETGRLALSMDDEFGRLQELTSTEVELLTEGESLNVAGEAQTHQLTIDSPKTGDTIQGGTFNLSGVVHDQGRSVNIQLVNREGRVISTDDVFISSSGGDEREFSAVLVYGISEPEWVQVVVSLRVAGVTRAVTSVEIWLEP